MTDNTLPDLPREPMHRILGAGSLTLDAWGRQKTVQDYSLLHGMFTYSIPVGVWKESLNGVEQTSFVNATSVNGKLHLDSAGATTNVSTFRHPRYEPNRGHIYSISAFLPSPEALGIRDFGLFTAESGVFFRVRTNGLYACLRTTVDTVTTTKEEKITHLPKGIDLSKGNVYDIQMQWRGVGNIGFFIGDPTTGVSKRVHEFKNLNVLTELSLFNPALPLAFECTNTGANVVIECGCVDVSSEGGKNYDGTYGAVSIGTNSGSVAVTGYNPLVLAYRILDTFNGLINTRDTLNLAINGYADQKSLLRVWVTRDLSAVSNGTQTWAAFGDGHSEYLEVDPAAGTPATFDTAKAALQFGVRVPQDSTLVSGATFDKAASLTLTPGDMLIFTIHRENGGAANVGLTYEFSEGI